MFQDDICPLTGDHLQGIDCLADEQVLMVMVTMDPQTLLNCGRASPRLYRLLCDRVVWRHLLKGVNFTKEMMEELRVLGQGLFGISGSPEMMPEVVKEAAQRFPVKYQDFLGNIKIVIAIQSWGEPETFEVDGNKLEELTRVADAVGAKFVIKSLEESEIGGLVFEKPFFTLIDAHIAQQEEGLLDKLELDKVSLPGGWMDFRKFFFNLQRASREWSVQELIVYKRMDFATLARYSGSLHTVNTLHFRAHYKLEARWQDDVKRVWRKCNKFVFRIISGPINHTPDDVEFLGGKEGGGDAEWQRILQLVFEI